LRRALRELAALGRVRRISSFHPTRPEGYLDQPDFVNAVAEIDTGLAPEDLLAGTRAIERRLGRTATFRNGPRVIDIDLIDVRGLVHDSATLTLPHPRMTSRRFVLEPLVEIAPRWRHPVTGETVSALLAALKGLGA
jgi:2-amino-4-hydroxy-6-hydroxymethyldihydropteridine diphosphokinase